MSDSPFRTTLTRPVLRAVELTPEQRADWNRTQIEFHIAEVRRFALAHIDTLTEALERVTQLASEVDDFGAAYPVGAADLARRVGEEARRASLTLTALKERI